jgi:ABC-2 type transport system permease protein
MLNVIKMDLYRMFRSRSTYLVLIGISLFMAFMIQNMHGSIGKEADPVIIGIGNNPALLSESMTLQRIFQAMASSRIFMLGIAVFSVMFINREDISGFTKNIAGQVQNRGMLSISKFVSISVYVILTFVVGVVVLFFVGNMIFESITVGNIVGLLAEMGLQILFHIAFAAIILGIITLVKQAVVSMLIGILLPMGGFAFLYQALNDGIHKLVGSDAFNINDYTVTGIVATVSTHSTTETIIRSIIVSLAFIVVMLAYSATMKQKRDVN